MIPFNNLSKHINIVIGKGLIPTHIIINFKNTIFYFLPSIISLFINIYTTPIFTKILSHADYAIIGYFGSIQSFLLPILNLSLFPFYMKEFHVKNKHENDEILTSITLFLTFINLGTIGIATFFVFIYFKITDVIFPFSPYIFFALFASYFSIYISLLKMKYKMQKKARNFALLSLSFTITNIIFGLILVVVYQLGAKGNMGAMLLAQGLIGILSFFILVKDRVINFTIIRNALSLGYPIIIASLLELPILYIDRILLERQNNVVELGLYNIGMIFSGYLLIMNSSIFQAFEPDLFRFIQKKDYKKLKITVLILFGTMFLCNIIYTIFSKNIISLLTGNKYTAAYHYSNVFIWSDFLLQISYFLIIFFIVQNKTNKLLFQKIILACISLIIFPLAISKWNFNGAAFSRIIISFISCLIFLYFLIISKQNNKNKSII